MSKFFRVNTSDIPFTFRCLECKKEAKLNIHDVIETGEPMCCDKEMDIDEYCYFKKV